ncbi:MAG: hypothetical protein J6P57_09740 [Lachnospiraceae bacterium]|nr:hypothetical protein [Lachnospiraceae bacterium]
MLQSKIKLSKKELIGLVFLTILVTSCFGSVVEPIAELFMQEATITVRRVDDALDRNVTILYEVYEENDDELFLQLKEANNKNNNLWNYVQGVTGKSWTMLVDTPECTDISIKTKISPRKYMTLLCNRGGGIVEIDTGLDVLTIDCYRDQDSSDILRVYLYEHNRQIIIIKIFIYIVFFVFFLIVDTVLFLLFKFKFSVHRIMSEPIEKIDFLICMVLLFGVAVFIYKVVGIPNYLQVGDEYGYWRTTIVHNNKLDWDYLAGQFAPRGYWCYIPQSIAHFIGNRLSVDASIIWMLILAITWSWFLTVVFPGIYHNFSGKIAKRIYILPMFIIMITVWRHYLTSVLMDGFGMISFFAFIYYISRFCEDKRQYRYAFLSGLFGAVSVSFRTANLIGVIGILVFEIIGSFIKKENNYRKTIWGLLIGIFSFMIICIPQLIINLHRGHMGFFPYDHDGAYYGRSVTTWSSDWSLANGNIAYPLLATDDQMNTMKKQIYNNESPLTMEQLFDVYINSPIESTMIVIKKLIIGFDIKTNIAHPGDGAVPWRSTKGMLFSLWNYFLLFSGLFALFKNEEIKRKEKWMAGLIFAFIILPETFMKIEWRYIITGYFLIYYFFAFYFIVPLMENKEERMHFFDKTGYLTRLSVFMVSYMTLSFMFLA